MTSLFSFPFEQIGSVLRTLSLSGNIGNIFAILLYIVFCSSPLIYFFVRCTKRKQIAADYLLFLISLSFFGGIYLYINPGYINQLEGFSTLSAQALFIVGTTIWSLIICYILFRILHGIENKEAPDLLMIIRYVITAIIILTLLDILGTGILSLISEIRQTAANNTAYTLFEEVYVDDIFSGYELNNTYIWLIVKYLLNCIPSIMLLCALWKARNIVRMLQEDSYSEAAIKKLHRLGISCRNIVITIGILAVVQNIIQLILVQHLLTTDYRLNIPIYTLLFVFIILLLSKKFSESREQKLDNDLFI